MQKTFLFVPAPITSAQTTAPEGYTGLYGFHKYWGKKPHEPIAYLIEQLSQPGQLVIDPFLGSGIAAREAVSRGRRFVGFDVNPVAVELSRFITSPPAHSDISAGFKLIQSAVKDQINASYALANGDTATHYLWDRADLRQVWIKGDAGTARQELDPTEHDLALQGSFASYQSVLIRSPRFFSNGRINASPEMNLTSLLTHRTTQH